MTTWTPEAEATLKAFWTEGLSASTIALRFSGAHITRNAVLGKVHRLHLERRAPSPGGRVAQTREERNAKARAANAVRRLAAKQLMNGHSPSLAPINGKARHMRPRLWKARHASPVPAPAYAGEPKLITELPAGRGCRYAVTETKPFRFCGASGYPWCPHHQAIVWRPL